MKPDSSLICNTTLLSNFAAMARLDLIPRLFAPHPVFTTDQVVDEIGAGALAGYAHLAPLLDLLHQHPDRLPVVALLPAERSTYDALRLHLHAGEASCLAIAIHRGYTLGTDDLAARRTAQRYNVPVIGTVGALVLGRRGLLTLGEANAMLAHLIAAGYRSPVQTLDELWS